jgi:hypothetical protein
MKSDLRDRIAKTPPASVLVVFPVWPELQMSSTLNGVCIFVGMCEYMCMCVQAGDIDKEGVSSQTEVTDNVGAVTRTQHLESVSIPAVTYSLC